MDKIRLNKYLSSVGFCSRRKADELVSEGRIIVNGLPAQNGMGVSDEDEIAIDGVKVTVKMKEQHAVWLGYYKPRGLVCSREGQGSSTIWEALDLKENLISVGRLDKDSEGLLLLTNQGDASDRLSRARNHHEKEYIVDIDRPVTGEFIKKMSSGVEILGTVTRECRVYRISKYRFGIVLTQGLNRQIRRMCKACGANVTALKRIRFCNVALGDMKPGDVRELTDEEIMILEKIGKE